MQPDIERVVREFVSDNYLYRNIPLSPDDSLIAGGYVDSTGILELVSFLETTFSLEIADEELIPDNLDSIGRITRFVNRKLSEASGCGGNGSRP